MFEKFTGWFQRPKYDELDENRVYSDKELIAFLHEKHISLGLGNTIILALITRLEARITELELLERNRP